MEVKKIKQINLINWKSFSKAELFIDPLTILIGTNASGKSNALDGLAFLNSIAMGRDFQTALSGDPTLMFGTSIGGIRGGVDWAALKPGNQFTLQTVIQENDTTDYFYSITINTLSSRAELQSESLTRYKLDNRTIQLYRTDEPYSDSPGITARLYNRSAGNKKECKRSTSILSQLKDLPLRTEIEEGINCVSKYLQGIFVLDPIPDMMRNYSRLSNMLSKNSSNIAGVLAALPKDEKKRLEDTITKYVRKLPERDIRKVWVETVGRFNTDAMLYCMEDWAEGKQPLTMDARGMSDGTLRFIAVLTALLTRPANSLIVIEEIDNGLHPSRTGLLIEMLKDIGTKRNVDILVTTHNPALLDALGPEMVPFIVVSHRDNTSGESKLTLLEDINNLPKLLACGSLGKLTTKGTIEKSLKIRGEVGE